jgi:glutamate synthase (NADPH/NADH) small chain
MTTGRSRHCRRAVTENTSQLPGLHPLGKHRPSSRRPRYFCYDAPCGCPTGIDIPLFIREIFSDNPKGAAETILAENILGGMCARVCPTETLCEEACVREAAEGKPVRIGELQRYATDTLMAEGKQPFTRGRLGKRCRGRRRPDPSPAPTGSPCTADVVIFDARVGGLSSDIAAYKSVNNFARRKSLHPGHRRHQHRTGKSSTAMSLARLREA